MENKIKNFYQLDSWKVSHQIVLQVYKITNNFPTSESFGIISQMRRAASSITANIAEGFERYHFKDKIRFYYQARGSVAELQNFLILSRDLGLINNDMCGKLGESANKARQLINGLIRSANNQNN